MTVAELIAELQKLPPDVPVVVEGYEKGMEGADAFGACLNPEHVEGMKNEITGVRAVIWASLGDGSE